MAPSTKKSACCSVRLAIIVPEIIDEYAASLLTVAVVSPVARSELLALIDSVDVNGLEIVSGTEMVKANVSLMSAGRVSASVEETDEASLMADVLLIPCVATIDMSGGALCDGCPLVLLSAAATVLWLAATNRSWSNTVVIRVGKM